MNTQLQHLLDDAVASKQIAGGNVKILKYGKEIAYAQSGYADIEQQKPFQRDTILRLYSMSKPITGAAIMLLLERGQIDLAQSVSDFLPAYTHLTVATEHGIQPCSRAMTVKDLLSMASGLGYGGDDLSGQAVSALIEEAKARLGSANEMNTYEFANRLGETPLSFVPASHFMYGTSADVLGAIVEIVSGMSFGSFLQKEFFEPLEMYDTGFWVKPEKQPRLSKVYTCDGQNIIPYTENNLAIYLPMDHSPAFESGGAGLASTLEDYAHFAAMLLNNGTYRGKQILHPQTVRYFTQAGQLPWQRDDLWHSWMSLEGFEYSNLLRIMKEPSLSVKLTTMGEYGWDGWLGPYFANHPSNGITILMGVQKKDAGTFSLTRKIINIVLSNN
ncbi:MAG: serine hydrolase domain-containing protein [Lachnospiraceae bacterium]